MIVSARRNVRARERVGTHYAAEVCADWEAIKLAVMGNAVRAKFDQNPQILELYARVSHLTLIHEAKSDRHWGMNRAHQGDNRLGTLIKTVCNELILKK